MKLYVEVNSDNFIGIVAILTNTYLASSLSMTSLLRTPSLESARELVVGSRFTVWKNPFLSISVASAAAKVRSLANDQDINQSTTSFPATQPSEVHI